MQESHDNTGTNNKKAFNRNKIAVASPEYLTVEDVKATQIYIIT